MSSSSPQTPTASTVRRPSVTKWIIVFILRLMVLSGFTAGAIALGLVAGHFSPTANSRPPLFLRLLADRTAESETTQPVLNETVATLREEDKAAIAQEIQGIQEQLQVLTTRTQKLEVELDLDPQQGNLATRLTNLTALLEANPEETPISASSPASPARQGVKITLPSTALFTEDGQLKPEAEDILEAIAIDLQQLQGRTITIAGHAFPTTEISPEEISFQQAQSVRVYLENQVPGESRWLVIGYGDNQPLAANDPNANQRIEIIAE